MRRITSFPAALFYIIENSIAAGEECKAFFEADNICFFIQHMSDKTS